MPTNRGPYVAAVPTTPTGNIMAQENGLPLIIERGLGHVFYMAFDLGLAPLDTLVFHPQFMPHFAGYFHPQSSHFVEHADPSDIRSGLALIPDQTLPKPATVAIYLIIYILVLGPANYFILNRFKRREWAWFSIPVIIFLFSGYGYFSGFRLRSGRPLVRQIAILQAESGAPLANLDAFVGIYSPHRAGYTLELDTPTALVESLPDSYGINSELTVTGDNTTTIIENLRADIGGIPGIIAHSHTASPKIKANLRYHRVNNQITGHIINDTGQPIAYAQLVMQNKVLNLNTLSSGETQVDGIAYNLGTTRHFYQFDDDDNDPQKTMQLASQDMTLKAVFGLNNYEELSLNFALMLSYH